MGRKPRIPSETGYYHVVARGNRHEAIFREPNDYTIYCRYIKQACQRYHIRVAHFCLMPNHTHLLAWAENIEELSQAMHHVQRRYWFHGQRAYGLTGHLWQGRFHSFPVETEAYLLEAARYIERNPLEAKLVAALEQYPWSSFCFYITGSPTPVPLYATPMYEALGRTRKTRRNAYRTFVETPQPYDHSMRQKLEKVAAYA